MSELTKTIASLFAIGLLITLAAYLLSYLYLRAISHPSVEKGSGKRSRAMTRPEFTNTLVVSILRAPSTPETIRKVRRFLKYRLSCSVIALIVMVLTLTLIDLRPLVMTGGVVLVLIIIASCAHAYHQHQELEASPGPVSEEEGRAWGRNSKVVLFVDEIRRQGRGLTKTEVAACRLHLARASL